MKQGTTALVVLLLAAFALRMSLCVYRGGLGQTPAHPYREYVIVADRLLTHGTLTSPLLVDETDSTPSALMPPGYALLIAVVYALLGAESFTATLVLQILNALATTLAVAVVFVVARRLGNERAAWMAAVVTALNPATAGFTPLIWDTSLFTLGVALTVWMVAKRFGGSPANMRRLAFGLWLGVLALLNPALTIAYPFLVLWSLSASKGWRFRAVIRGVGLTMVGWLIAIAPWTIRNLVHFDHLLYIRSGFNLELWLGVCPQAEEDPGAIFDQHYPLEDAEAQQRIATVGEQAFLAESGRKAVDAIRADPWRFLRLSAIRTMDYWLGTVFTHTDPGEGGWPREAWRAATTVVLGGEIVGIVVLLFIRSAGAGRPMNPNLYWLLAIIVVVSLVYCLTHVQVRFRAPFEPLIAITLALLACPRPSVPNIGNHSSSAFPPK